ncbi:MAG TPA: hypothetical protein VFG83_18080, partial [Kofleriaceae bacterium]|nr:hypothetical protein [Kofleriaceae bacterium]
ASTERVITILPDGTMQFSETINGNRDTVDGTWTEATLDNGDAGYEVIFQIATDVTATYYYRLLDDSVLARSDRMFFRIAP